MTSTSPATISVVIPVRNGEAYLGETLDSVCAQTTPPDEIIVVDDGSSDNSVEVARGFGTSVTVLCQEPLGIGAARNAGIEASSGDHLSFLDADDLWLPDSLEILGRALDTPPGYDLVFGAVEEFLSPDLRPELANKLRCRKERHPAYLAGGMRVRREVFRRVGVFRKEPAEFMQWYLKARDRSVPAALLPHLVLRRRVHGRNNSYLDPAIKRAYLELARDQIHSVSSRTQRTWPQNLSIR